MHILVTGSRKWTDRELVRIGLTRAVRSVCSPSPPAHLVTLVSGGAQGADLLAMSVAKELGWQISTYVADWDKHGKKAGPIRNQRMLDEEQPIICAAFLIPELPCRGTRDMMERCYVSGVPVYVTPGAWHR